ncbi:MAG: aldehyde dehydrogenase family protein [Actinomycetaceae bacterium]|nr:aldehyde dehydrogenase family protein [Actinomycetaceae bacterium]
MIPTGIPQRFLRRLVAPAQEMTGDKFSAIQVWTGQPLVSFPTASAADLARAAEQAREAQVRWAAMPVSERWRLIDAFGQLVSKNREKLIRLLQVFGGQSRFDAFDQYQDTYNSAIQFAQFVRRRLGPAIYHGAVPFISRLRIERLPVGLVGVFTLTDYQMSYPTVDVLPAIAAGNAVVQFVPAQAYPVTMAVRELGVAAGIPAEVWQVMPSTSTKLGRRHIELFDHITYIGNSATGVSLQQDCLDAGVATTMFMSVKNHAVVLADADLEVAVRSVAWQAFMNAGCSSVHIEKVHVDRTVYDAFVRELRSKVTRRVVIGTSYDHRATMGSLYSQLRLDRTQEHLQDALDLGADLVCGGSARPDIGPWFHEPTIIENVSHDALVYDEETYGPLLIVEPFDDIDEVTDEMSHSQYCYAMQVFTEDMELAQRVARASGAGFVAINDGYHMTWGAWNAPVQGWRDTGAGLRHGMAAVRQYTRSCLTSRQMLYSGEPQADQPMERWEKLSLWALNASVKLHSL